MRAVRMHRTGDPSVLRVDDVPVPEPNAGEVLIKVEAAGVTFGDVMKREGAFGSPSLPAGLGLEVAGTVHKLGPGVSADLPLGSRVIGWVDHGYAEFAVASAGAVIPIPANLAATAAAAIPVHGVTAHPPLPMRTSNRASSTAS